MIFVLFHCLFCHTSVGIYCCTVLSALSMDKCCTSFQYYHYKCLWQSEWVVVVGQKDIGQELSEVHWTETDLKRENVDNSLLAGTEDLCDTYQDFQKDLIKS